MNADRTPAAPLAPADRRLAGRVSLLLQFARFAVVGVSNTLLSLGVFAVLDAAGAPYGLAAALAFAAGAANGYVWNRRWTFSARGSRTAQLRYVVVQAGGLALTDLLVWLLVGKAGLPHALGYLLSVPPVTIATFAANRRFTFAAPPSLLGASEVVPLAAVPSPAAREHGGAPAVDVVVPVYNEEDDLEPCVRRLHAHLSAFLPYAFRITVADNASVDRTWEIARALRDELAEVEAVHLDLKGRGRALKRVWTQSDAAVLAYMDVDLSTGLECFLPLVAPLLSGHSDLAIGSRLCRSARVVRGPKREVISRIYNLVLRLALRVRFSDAQCGFKAIRADRARLLLPLVEDDGWFFDTELLVLAQRTGMRIHEVPADWVDDPDSRVDVVSTALADLRGVARLLASFALHRLPLDEVRDELRRNGRGRDAGPQPIAGSV